MNKSRALHEVLLGYAPGFRGDMSDEDRTIAQHAWARVLAGNIVGALGVTPGIIHGIYGLRREDPAVDEAMDILTALRDVAAWEV